MKLRSVFILLITLSAVGCNAFDSSEEKPNVFATQEEAIERFLEGNEAIIVQTIPGDEFLIVKEPQNEFYAVEIRDTDKGYAAEQISDPKSLEGASEGGWQMESFQGNRYVVGFSDHRASGHLPFGEQREWYFFVEVAPRSPENPDIEPVKGARPGEGMIESVEYVDEGEF